MLRLLENRLPFAQRRAFRDWLDGKVPERSFRYPVHLEVGYRVCTRQYSIHCTVCGHSTWDHDKQRRTTARFLRAHRRCGFLKESP